MIKAKPRKCKNPECREVFTPRYSTLQQACSPQCAVAVAKNKEKKKKAEAKKAWNKEKKRRQRRDKKWVVPKIQSTINEIARLIDCHLPCLATGNYGQIHGGHVFSVKNNGNIRYNLHNIHRQNAQSNKWESHDILMRERLAEEYGDAYLDFLKAARKKEAPKLYEDDLALLYERSLAFRNKLKKLVANSQDAFDKDQRITLRNEANLALHIYDKEICVYCKK